MSLLDLQLFHRLRVDLTHAMRDEEREGTAQRYQSHDDHEDDLPHHHVVVDAEVPDLVLCGRRWLFVLEHWRVPWYCEHDS